MIRRQVVLPVSPERVWDALTDPDQVAGWFGGRMTWDLQVGGAASFQGDDGTARLGRIETIRPGRHLRFVWWPAPAAGAAEGRADGGADAGAAPGGHPSGAANGAEEDRAAPPGHRSGDATGEMSEVSYLLEPHEGGTRLTIQERQVSIPAQRDPEGRTPAQHGPQASAAPAPATMDSGMAWTPWDRRLLGAWAGLVGSPAAVARF